MGKIIVKGNEKAKTLVLEYGYEMVERGYRGWETIEGKEIPLEELSEMEQFHFGPYKIASVVGDVLTVITKEGKERRVPLREGIDEEEGGSYGATLYRRIHLRSF